VRGRTPGVLIALGWSLAVTAVFVPALFAATPAPETSTQPDYARIFHGRDACFELYDMKANRLLARYGGKRCAERVPPCSTFKVPLSLMAFDAGIFTTDHDPIPWNGTKAPREVWNQDQTPATWMSRSVVWVSQRITPRLGQTGVRDYLAKLDYGNRDTSGGLTRFWLMSSLKISPDEQLQFWIRFWRGRFPVSQHASELTRAITLVDVSPAGWTLHGKTGSGGIGERDLSDDTGFQLGWFAGHVANGDRELIFVTNFSDTEKNISREPAGWIARDLTKEILHGLGFY
jgi:beta-lactamase class D